MRKERKGENLSGGGNEEKDAAGKKYSEGTKGTGEEQLSPS
jgi:hypothetical protein